METIKVNMNPNPLDVQTIHASQNDGEARQWGFKLHNNGDVIDSSEVTDQMVFKAYKGGTEQLLPENTSTPVTSPFKGDIKYPQGLLTDQKFTYRQSPTEKDGNAKITDIKGNTIVWNQLVQNGNFTSTSGWGSTRGTITANNNICQLTATETGTLPQSNRINYPNITPLVNHTYLISAYIKVPRNTVGTIGFTQVDYWPSFNLQANVKTKVSTIYTFGTTSASINLGIGVQANANEIIEISNVQMFDLTQMGLDITSPSDFTSLFPLSYYSYNQGSLLSFNGNGIKTTGKNLLKTNISSETINGVTFTVNKDENGELTEIIVSGTATQRANFFILPPGTDNVLSTGRYILSSGYDSQNIYMSSYNTTTGLGYRATYSGVEVPYVTGEDYSIYISVLAGATANNLIFKPMLRLIDIEDSTFEPYTSSTLSLPISAYFPTGMKSAGNVYDELKESKAITRLIKTIVDGTNVRATYYGVYLDHQLFYIDLFGQTLRDSSYVNALLSNMYNTSIVTDMDDKHIRYQNTANGTNIGRVYWTDDRYTSASAMNTALQVDPLEIISLAQTQTETSFTTASLVTENAEIPLSNNDGTLIGKCTEELSAEPGFHDAKIKLSDSDGECYSNKIQLHVERSPQ